MIGIHKPFHSLNAGDLMSRELIMIPQEMSLQAAARLLSRHHISGAPVVDAEERCVGVLSNTDFVHRVEKGKCVDRPEEAGTCHSAWQVVEKGERPSEQVAAVMTRDVVTVEPEASIAKVAHMMLEAHIHRVIVVDPLGKPIGIVTSTDILAAVANLTESAVAGPHRTPAYTS